MIQDYLVIVLKNLKKRSLRSFLTILGILIGIAAVVSLISLGNGLQNAINSQFDTLDPDKITITSADTGFGPPGSTAVKKLNKNDVEIISKINGVDIVIERLIRTVEVEYNGISDFSYIVDIPSDNKKIEVVYDFINVLAAKGRLLNKNDKNAVIIGDDYNDKRFGKELRVGKKLNIQGRSFKILGILERAGTFTINSAILMPRKDLQTILEIEDEFDILVVKIKNLKEIERIKKDIEEALRKDRGLKKGEEDFSVQTPKESLETINKILSIINLIIGAIAAISLIIGGLGIASTMYTSVIERTKEIGIMKSIGAKNRDILSLFLIEAGMLGIVGGIFGSLIGINLAFLFSYVFGIYLPEISFNVEVSYSLILGAIFFSFIIGTISGIWPARQASKLRPMEALRR
tara:strand:- start:5445 stop:6659 length:1215 start_codon:yes stop_codon:yes gene_type:complete